MALLECPLCLDQLDVSAKVLPCQHTFCMPCLQRHETAHSQLHCPECRAPIQVRTMEELPENLLLVRLLEGLQGSAGSRRKTQTVRYAVPLSRSSLTAREDQLEQQESQPREKRGYSEVSEQPQHTSCCVWGIMNYVNADLWSVTLKEMSYTACHYIHVQFTLRVIMHKVWRNFFLCAG